MDAAPAHSLSRPNVATPLVSTDTADAVHRNVGDTDMALLSAGILMVGGIALLVGGSATFQPSLIVLGVLCLIMGLSVCMSRALKI